MHIDWPILERTGAVVGGIVVAIVAFYALYKDWKTPGLENQVFKLMLVLLGFGALLAIFAGAGVLGNFGKA
jgi:F0F1-type ATP synthase membrane subunit c/vacuolar-type H+-ATPase subunit K